MAERAGDKDAKKGKNSHVKIIGIGSELMRKVEKFNNIRIAVLCDNELTLVNKKIVFDDSWIHIV